tara:strand:- start:4020 stop:4760 length:741 start_codon:yes stop_codon:yes gene_type:complete
MVFIDKKFRLPRLWSNQELRKFAHLFPGDVVNVSGWNDGDKEGSKYEEYFKNASSYSLTNFKEDSRGFQGFEGEIFLDLSKPISSRLVEKFDVVFNHTVLEHIFEVDQAFENLCEMSRDVVILVTPFLQEEHASYGDYWRFTPACLKRMFSRHGFEVIYQTFNSHKMASCYVFTIATRASSKWVGKIPRLLYERDPVRSFDSFCHKCGCHAIPNLGYESKVFLIQKLKAFKSFLRKVKRKVHSWIG